MRKDKVYYVKHTQINTYMFAISYFEYIFSVSLRYSDIGNRMEVTLKHNAYWSVIPVNLYIYF